MGIEHDPLGNTVLIGAALTVAAPRSLIAFESIKARSIVLTGLVFSQPAALDSSLIAATARVADQDAGTHSCLR